MEIAVVVHDGEGRALAQPVEVGHARLREDAVQDLQVGLCELLRDGEDPRILCRQSSSASSVSTRRARYAMADGKPCRYWIPR